MSTRLFSEYAKSGEIEEMLVDKLESTTVIEANHVIVDDNITMVKGSDPESIGMFVRLAPGGQFTAYRAPDQDVHWIDEDATEVSIPVTLLTLLSVTVDEEVTPADGTFQISMRVDNTTNQDTNLTVELLVDDVLRGSQVTQIKKNIIGTLILFNGPIVSDIPNGGVVSVDVSGSETGLIAKGDLFVSKLTITKAQAAPVVKNQGQGNG